jgi:hypothetical protein
MKKLLILGLGVSLLATTLTVQAQNAVSFGIKAGGNMMMGGKAELGGTEYTTKYLPGFQGGFYAEIPLSSSFTFKPEVLYSQKGFKVDETVGTVNGVIKTRAGYIDVPVLFAFNATPSLSFVLGPQASFLTNQTTRTYVNGNKVTTSDSKEDFRKSIAAGVVGLGFKATPNVNLGLRYSHDFQSLTTDELDQDKARFSGFALSVGYGF